MRGARVAPVAPEGVGPLLDGYSGRLFCTYFLVQNWMTQLADLRC